MATVITSECINCGACEPECPNNAIYQGGAEWELNGQRHPPVANDIFYIVPSKCSECVGFYDHEACAAVCPVDCCVPDPKIPETEQVLIERAKQLHPDQLFGEDFPSRFRQATGPGQRGAAAPAAPLIVPPRAASVPVTPSAPPAAAPAPAAASPAPAATPPRPPAAPAPAPAAASALPIEPAPVSPPASSAKAPPKAPPAPPAGAASPMPAEAGASFPPSTEAAPAVVLPSERDWDIPIVCRACEGEYPVAFRHLRPGVVLYCPHCRASFVPTRTTYLRVAGAVERFSKRSRQEFESFHERRHRELEEFESRQRAALADFEGRLREFATAGQRATGRTPKRWFV